MSKAAINDTHGTVEISQALWNDYIRLQEAAKANGWTLFDILREVGTMEVSK